jgi:competence protein ComEA
MKVFIGMIIFSIVYMVGMELINKKLETINFETEHVAIESDSNLYSVTITGAVNNPGTYTVSKGDKLSYLISLAGGLTDYADASAYNLNVYLENGVTYYIGYNNDGNEKVSINTATIASLDTLPGIGNVIATRIVSYRNSNGSFKTIEEIKKVNGIGDALFEQIKDLICL